MVTRQQQIEARNPSRKLTFNCLFFSGQTFLCANMSQTHQPSLFLRSMNKDRFRKDGWCVTNKRHFLLKSENSTFSEGTFGRFMVTRQQQVSPESISQVYTLFIFLTNFPFC
ncbi:hypothetical protein AVEN_209394-1 [Araneus ventricosus]|uniref:Uncharacterized protein n=1 Tax=Araneus ventricosus TaxID=182803 RepID=A0A4Y2PR86_ARAVE|nr:hypothetical protein AVEN_209394-1 [Araneus ventricosus]